MDGAAGVLMVGQLGSCASGQSRASTCAGATTSASASASATTSAGARGAVQRN